MKTVAALLSAVLLLILIPTPTAATGCRIVAPVRQAYYTPAYSAAVQYVAPAIQYVPYYGASYVPQALGQNDLATRVEELTQALDRLTQQLGSQGPLGLQSQAEQRMVELTRRHCAKCHTAGSEKGGLILFDSPGAVTLAELSPEMPGLIAARVGIDEMPPTQPKLTPEEKGAVMQWVIELRGRQQPAGTPQRLPVTMPPANGGGVKP